ncbi:MAG TPA: tRNA (5-methylaminomethyl-2-thiouridine)(34)-methyltransferase MnmD [Dysgonamonadaceae bacterium]|nr:tRNA (5-methylaminomethyl-2-thiouridine)(34)-methyltransferase MnmD [Dysgonamonadaceae bacterium]
MHAKLNTEMVTTEDGSHSLYVPHLNEHYHSTHGAIQESRHVYIHVGLHACQLQQTNILEIGFGTGLNALLTLLECDKTNKQVHYTSLELYPLDLERAAQLNYAHQLGGDRESALFMALHKAPWDESMKITPTFDLHKIETDFSNPNNFNTNTRFDLIYFDAFAPEKQPDMWTQQIFDKLFSLCNKNAVITTYCAKGVVRRMLQSAGFAVERLPGPPGKREILRGRKV